MIDDTRTATDWLIQQPSVDVNQLAIVGSSIGGYVTLNAGAHDRHFKYLVAMCPFIDGGDVPLSPEYAIESANTLNGISAEQLKFEWDHITPILTFKDQLIDRNVLLITGGQDALFPLSHHRPLIDALPHIRWTQLIDGDHTFNTCRKQLVKVVVDWLLSQTNP